MFVSSGRISVFARRREFPEGLPSDRTALKNAVKQLIYKTLSEMEGRTLPWGALTGIRPVKIPTGMLEKGMSVTEIAGFMRKTYFTSPEKTALAIAVAKREKALLERLNADDGYSLYIGIPFCPSICLYCSFGSHPLDRFGYLEDDYIEALQKELSFISAAMRGNKLTSVYIGGGTPSSLSVRNIDRLLSHVRNCFGHDKPEEVTFEAGRPDTVTPEKLSLLRGYGITRLSINPQTMNDKTLALIGRNHTSRQVEEAFAMARDAGFDNINADIIVGLPGEGAGEVRATLDRLCDLFPDSLTVHSLALKRAARLNRMREQYAPVSFENSQEIMNMIGRRAEGMGLEPYYLYRQKNIAGNLENVGYARDGCFGIYNVLIMEEKQTIMAAGSGAVSKYVYPDGRIERTCNVKDVSQYIGRIDEMIARKENQLKRRR